MSNKNLFNTVKVNRPKRNFFDLSHDVKLSCNAGHLIPTMWMDCVPGDRVKIGCNALIRLAPLLAPMMHRVDVTMHYWFVPYRLLWPNWERFITGVLENGQSDPTPPALPFMQFQYTGYADVDPLNDYLGIPPTGANTINVSAFPHAAFQRIWHEWYRDQNLIDADKIQLLDGDNGAQTADLIAMRRRSWQHDYFTAALPFAQKGAAVDLPLGEFNDVHVYRDAAAGATELQAAVGTNVTVLHEATPDLTGELYANTSELIETATTINDLRRAMKLQEWLELAARAGSRYVEQTTAMFGVRPQDARLQRPEYITGTKSPVVISEVLNTTGTETRPQGDMAGHGVSVNSGGYGSYQCYEHGIIMGIMSIMPQPAYQQGMSRLLTRDDRYDFYWPQFAHIGEQEVANREIYAAHSTPAGTFGYVPRYSEHKYMPNRVSGDFRTSLDFWTWARQFSADVNLNQAFVECNPDYRPFAVTDPDVDHFWCHVLHDIKASRPMPKFGTPSF